MPVKKTSTGRAQQRKMPELEVTEIDDDADAAVSTALYGRSNSGKTTLSATWPKPLLYIDIKDRGSKSIRDVKGIKKRTVETFEQFEETYWWLVENPEAYNTVVIDTVTQLQRIAVEEHHSHKRTSKGSRSAGDWGSMTKKDWGDVAALMKEWIINYRDLVDLGIEVVFIAQDRTFNMGEDEDDVDEGLAPEIGPALSPAVAKLLNASVDVIGNTFVRTRTVKANLVKKTKAKEIVEYCLRVGPNSLYITKVRKPKSIEVPSILVDPEYEDIMAIIKGD